MGASCGSLCENEPDMKEYPFPLPELMEKEIWFQIHTEEDFQHTWSHLICSWTYMDCAIHIPILLDIQPSFSNATNHVSFDMRLYTFHDGSYQAGHEIPLWPHYQFDAAIQVDIFHQTQLICRRTTPIFSMDKITVHSMFTSLGSQWGLVSYPLDVRVHFTIRLLAPSSIPLSSFLKEASKKYFLTRSDSLMYTTDEKQNELESEWDSTSISQSSNNNNNNNNHNLDQSIIREMKSQHYEHFLQMVLNAYDSSNPPSLSSQ
jgi:hypothetical protein